MCKLSINTEVPSCSPICSDQQNNMSSLSTGGSGFTSTGPIFNSTVERNDIASPSATSCDSIDVESSNPHINNDCGVLKDTNCGQMTEESVSDEGDISEESHKLPSLADIYMKNTKTLNTNVLVQESDEEEIATDSEKFLKHDNNQLSLEHEPYEQQINEFLSSAAKGANIIY